MLRPTAAGDLQCSAGNVGHSLCVLHVESGGQIRPQGSLAKLPGKSMESCKRTQEGSCGPQGLVNNFARSLNEIQK